MKVFDDIRRIKWGDVSEAKPHNLYADLVYSMLFFKVTTIFITKFIKIGPVS